MIKAVIMSITFNTPFRVGVGSRLSMGVVINAVFYEESGAKINHQMENAVVAPEGCYLNEEFHIWLARVLRFTEAVSSRTSSTSRNSLDPQPKL